MTLDRLPPGRSGWIVSTGKQEELLRLRDLGLLEGNRIECLAVSPLGDPVVFRLLGSAFALRRRDCRGIQIRLKEEDNNGGRLPRCPGG